MAAGLYDITTETLGKGHFAVVKLAHHCLTGESVAIKIIDKARLNKEGLQQLSCEIRLWSRLSEHEHPNVVKLYQVIDTRTKLYLVMEYCGRDVCDLYDHIQKRNHGNGLKESEAKHIFRQICSAISYCHSSRIVHRDLKPENILIIVQPQEQLNPRIKYPLVKLIDFGFSNQWADGEMLRTSCGSLAYSAPEILLGDHYDGPKVDIWGLGCILYILLYGSNPFMQINDSETLCRILDCTFTTPPRPSVSESVIELIKALLKRDPNTRLTIQQIITHPWLYDSDAEIADNVSKAPFVPKTVKKSVHDRVIDQMIAQGVGQTKEIIENSLEKARGVENNNTHKTSNPNHNTSEEVQVNGERTQSSVKNEHYIKATYHLLKDKLIREQHAINQPVLNSFGAPPKRLLPLKPRKHLIQQLSRITKPFHEEDSEDDNIESYSNGQSIQQLDIPSDDVNSFTLPLARKCSIVSEEGSCVADGTGSDLSSLEGPIHTHEDQSGAIPTVNIVVTDCSETDDVNDILNSNEEEECADGKGPNYETPILNDLSLVNNSSNKYGPVLINKNTANIANHPPLHSVSSSPELLRSGEELDTDESEYDNYIPQSIRNRPSNMILNSDCNRDKDVGDHIMSRFGANNSSIASNSPSMRIIVQSKSCNNILFNDNSDSSSKEPNNTLYNHLAINSNNGTIKRHRSERTDCCSIC